MSYEVIKSPDGSYSIWNTVISKYIARGLANPDAVGRFMSVQIYPKGLQEASMEKLNKVYYTWADAARVAPVSSEMPTITFSKEQITRAEDEGEEHYQDRIEHIAEDILDNLAGQYSQTCPVKPFEEHAKCAGLYSFMKTHLMRFVIANVDWSWVPELLAFNRGNPTDVRMAREAIRDLKVWTTEELDGINDDISFSDIPNIRQRTAQFREAFLSEFLSNLAAQYPSLSPYFLKTPYI